MSTPSYDIHSHTHPAFENTEVMAQLLHNIDQWPMAERKHAIQSMLATILWSKPNEERAALVINAAPADMDFEQHYLLLLRDEHAPYLTMLLKRRAHMEEPSPALIHPMQDAIIHNRVLAARLLLEWGSLHERINTWCAMTIYNRDIAPEMIDLLYHHPTATEVLAQYDETELFSERFAYIKQVHDAHERKQELSDQVSHLGGVRGARKL